MSFSDQPCYPLICTMHCNVIFFPFNLVTLYFYVQFLPSYLKNPMTARKIVMYFNFLVQRLKNLFISSDASKCQLALLFLQGDWRSRHTWYMLQKVVLHISRFVLMDFCFNILNHTNSRVYFVEGSGCPQHYIHLEILYKVPQH